jgi:hypothetical protein
LGIAAVWYALALHHRAPCFNALDEVQSRELDELVLVVGETVQPVLMITPQKNLRIQLPQVFQAALYVWLYRIP